MVFPDVPPTADVVVALSEPAFSTPVRSSSHPDAGEALALGASTRAAPASPTTTRRAGKRKRRV
jgi:hypothetical protein